MRRRDFITLLGGAAPASLAWPLAARAQQAERVRRIGVLAGAAEGDPEFQALIAAFRQGLRDLRWSEDRNLRIDYCWAAGDPNRLRACVAEMTVTPSDVILTISAQALRTVREATRSIPVVFLQVSDPVDGGFVDSMARPGGNITGFTNFEYSIGGKWLEVLKEIAPGVTRVLVVLNPDNYTSLGLLRTIETVAPSLRVQVSSARLRDPGEIEPAIEAFAREPNGGLIVLPDPLTVVPRERILSSAIRYRLPAVYPHRLFATTGGLLSYGTDLPDLYRRAASYVDRILKGEKPADLPVQAPVKFLLVVNLKTAKALGLTISESFLLRADEVIE